MIEVEMIRDILIYFSISLMIVGSVAGTFLKNYYVRLHFIGISDTIGATTLLLTFAVFSSHHLEYLFLSFFILLQGPAVTHILARGAVKAKINVEEKRWHSSKR